MRLASCSRTRRFASRLAALLLCVLIVGCDGLGDGSKPDDQGLARPWTTVAPEAVGLDAARLADAVAAAEAEPRFRSLLVVRRGRLALETYFHGTHADDLHDVRSVTKSVVGTLAGIALEEGLLGGLDVPVADHLPAGVDPLSADDPPLTVRHLLTMTSGLAWNEIGGSAYGDWMRSDDHLAYVLNRPRTAAPGAAFNYNSGAVHVLGVVLQEAVGMSLPEYADQRLFGPLGIDDSRWEALPGGYVNGGAGLDLRPRDLARLGQLYLQSGRSGDVQVVPEAWTREAVQPRFSWRSSFGPLQAFTYGYLWWVADDDAAPAYLAWGYGGQFIYVVPALDLVVVTTTDWRGLSSDGGANRLEEAALHVILDHVVPAAG